MSNGNVTIATLEGYIANAQAKIAKWERRIEEIQTRQAVGSHVAFAMKGFRSRFSLLTDEVIKERAWRDYTIDADEMDRTEVIQAMLDAEFKTELAKANGNVS